MTEEDFIAEKLQQIKAKYVTSLIERKAAIDQAWLHLEDQPDNPDSYIELRELLHVLAGSAGSFGFGELSAVARELEYLIVDAHTQVGTNCEARDMVALRQKMGTLTVCISDACD